jgi:hypothetical protein
MELAMIKLKAHQDNQGKERMDSPNSLVMKIIILSWVEDEDKDSHLNHHWRMESSSSPIGS